MRRVAALAGGTALALVAAGIAIRATAVRALPANHPTRALVAADSPDATLEAAMGQILNRQGRIDPALSDRAIAAARARPLDERPYVVAAIDAFTDRREAQGIALLERARALNPRQRVARLLLMDRYLRGGQIAAATREIAAVYRLVPDTYDPLSQELARLLADPASRDATRRALADQPMFLNAALAMLARSGMEPARLAEIAGRDAPPGLEPQGWRSVQIQTLIAQGAFARARESWRAAYRVTDADAAALPFDPRFTGAAPPPFGWELVASDVGSAERTADGLGVEYFGRRSGPLAGQLMLAPPGRYRLSYIIEGSDGGEAGSVAVTLTCAADSRVLATLPAPRLGGARKPVAADVAIPAECPAQWLRIVGVAREFASPTSATIATPTLRRLGE